MIFPDTHIAIKDDKECLAILAQEGLLGDFGGYTGRAEAHTELVRHVDHPTHWMVAVRFVGEPGNPTGIAHVIHIFPKSQYSIDDIDRFVAVLEEQHGGCDDSVTEYPDATRN